MKIFYWKTAITLQLKAIFPDKWRFSIEKRRLFCDCRWRTRRLPQVSQSCGRCAKIHEFCIQNHKFCIGSYVFCIKTDAFCIQNGAILHSNWCIFAEGRRGGNEPSLVNSALIMMDFALIMMDFALMMMDFALEIMNSALEMMNSVLTMMDSVLIMMDFALIMVISEHRCKQRDVSLEVMHYWEMMNDFPLKKWRTILLKNVEFILLQ